MERNPRKTFLENWLRYPDELCLFNQPNPHPSPLPPLLSEEEEAEQKNLEENNRGLILFQKNNVFYFQCQLDENTYFATNVQNKRLGEATLYENFLQHIVVQSDYQCQGIGTNLIRTIIKNHAKTLLIPYTRESNNLALYLTEEGAALINSCIRKGVIKEDQCIEDTSYILRLVEQDDSLRIL